MKTIVLFLLFLIPAFYGFSIAKKSEKSFKNNRYLHICLEKIHIKITQYLIPLGDIFYELSCEGISPFCDIFKNIHTRIEKGGESFKNILLSEFESSKDVLGFDEEQMHLIKNISEFMGCGNASGQEKHLDGLLKMSEKILYTKEEIFKKRSSAYKKIGILTGLFLVIVFI